MKSAILIFFIAILLILQPKFCSCQILNGTYSHADTNVSRYDIFTYTFQGNKFTASVFRCVGTDFGYGTYEIVKDSMFLYFEKNDSCPKVKITKIDSLTNNKFLKILAYNPITNIPREIKELSLLDENDKAIKTFYYDYYLNKLIELNKNDKIVKIKVQAREKDTPVTFKLYPNESQEIELILLNGACITKGEVWKYKIANLSEKGFTIIEEYQGKLFYSPFKRYKK